MPQRLDTRLVGSKPPPTRTSIQSPSSRRCTGEMMPLALVAMLSSSQHCCVNATPCTGMRGASNAYGTVRKGFRDEFRGRDTTQPGSTVHSSSQHHDHRACTIHLSYDTISQQYCCSSISCTKAAEKIPVSNEHTESNYIFVFLQFIRQNIVAAPLTGSARNLGVSVQQQENQTLVDVWRCGGVEMLHPSIYRCSTTRTRYHTYLSI